MDNNVKITDSEARLEDRIFKRMSTRYNLVIGGMVLGFGLLVSLIMTVNFFIAGEITTIQSEVVKANTYLDIIVNSVPYVNGQQAVNATGLP